MKTLRVTIDEAYLEYANRLLQHHLLLAEGKEMADETVAVEDEMTDLWERLDELQRKNLSRISSDLKWARSGVTADLPDTEDEDLPAECQLIVEEALRKYEFYAKPGQTPEQSLSTQLLKLALEPFSELINASDWEEALHRARVCAPIIPPCVLAATRGAICERMGLLQIAQVFYDLSRKLDRDDASTIK